MKKILFTLIFLITVIGFVWADSITLTSPETLSTPTSQKIGRWYISYISAFSKTLQVRYYWEDSNGSPISLEGNRDAWQTWSCQDIEVGGENADCTALGEPHPCCTDVGTGTCDDMSDTCFTDVFSFEIRQQDVGTGIGIGLRTLIWNQMKQDILTGGNDGTFD